MKWRAAALAGVLSVFGFTSTASAVELYGTVNIAGSVTVSANTIDWFPTGGTEGDNVIQPPVTGYFCDPVVGGFGACPNGIFNPNLGVTVDTVDLVGGAIGPVNVPNFWNDVTGNANPAYSDLTFDLTFIQPAVGPVCAGDIAVGTSCSFGAFLITQSAADSLTVSLTLNGFFRDPTNPDGTSSLLATGAYSTQGTLMTNTGGTVTRVSQLLAVILGGGSISASYSATYSAPQAPVVPEPATLLTFGLGSSLLALRRRQLARRKAAASVQ